MQETVRVAAVQAESVWLYLAAGVDKVISLIGEAAAGGAELVAFPETFLNPDLIAIAKSAADPVGHCSRPDVLRLLVNRNPAPKVVETPAEKQPAALEFTPA